MPSFNLSDKYIRLISTAFKRYRKIRKLILRNVDEYISDFLNFQGTPQEREEYLEGKYRPREPKENYIAVLDGKNIVFQVREIALLIGRDSSSVSRMLTNIERSKGWYSRLVSLRHESKSANNNRIYTYSRKIFDLIVDYKEYLYLERIKRAGVADFGAVMSYWNYLKKLSDYEDSAVSRNALKASNESTKESESSEFPKNPPVSWKDVIKIIGSKLFSIKVDMIFALAFAITFGLARRWTGLIPVFAAVSATLLAVCAFMLRHRADRTELIAETGAVMTLLALFWGVNLTMENGIYTPGGTVMNLTSPEPALRLEATRGSSKENPLEFFVNADNEADIKEIFYSINSDAEYKSTGRNFMGSVELWLRPTIRTDIVTINIKYTDITEKEHGPYKFTFDVEKECFNSGKNVLINDPDILFLTEFGNVTAIHTLANDTVKAVHYGINTAKPDRIFIPDVGGNFEAVIDCVIERVNVDVDFVSLYTEFMDGTSSDIHIKETESGRQSVPYDNESISL